MDKGSVFSTSPFVDHSQIGTVKKNSKQQCFIGFKNMRHSRVILNQKKQMLSVFLNSIKKHVPWESEQRFKVRGEDTVYKHTRKTRRASSLYKEFYWRSFFSGLKFMQVKLYRCLDRLWGLCIISINTQVIIQNRTLSLARYLGLSADDHLDGQNGCQ